MSNVGFGRLEEKPNTWVMSLTHPYDPNDIHFMSMFCIVAVRRLKDYYGIKASVKRSKYKATNPHFNILVTFDDPADEAEFILKSTAVDLSDIIFGRDEVT
jgi:hypothetical protein